MIHRILIIRKDVRPTVQKFPQRSCFPIKSDTGDSTVTKIIAYLITRV